MNGTAEVTASVRKRGAARRDVLGKALGVLSWIVDTPGDGAGKAWGVRELAQGLRLPPATVHRIVTTLLAHGLLRRDPDSGRYRMGMEFYRLASKAQSHLGFRDAAMPPMRDLVARCNEAALLALYDAFRREMMFVAAVYSDHPLRYVVPINEWIPVYAGASGLAIMAFLPPEERRAIAEQTRLVPLTQRTISNPIRLEEELARIRARGYAVSRGQRTVGAVGIAAPIWGPDGRVLGDLVVSVPEPRFQEKDVPRIGRLVLRYAQRIMEILGARPAAAGDPGRRVRAARCAGRP